MHIFTCKPTKLWFLPWKGDEEQRTFSESYLPSRCFRDTLYTCVLFPSPITYQAPCPVTVFHFTRFFICFGIHRPGCFPSLSAPGWIVNHMGSSIDLPPRFLSPLSLCGLPLPSLCPHQFWPGKRPGCLMDWCFLGTGVSGFQEAAVSVRW